MTKAEVQALIIEATAQADLEKREAAVRAFDQLASRDQADILSVIREAAEDGSKPQVFQHPVLLYWLVRLGMLWLMGKTPEVQDACTIMERAWARREDV